MKRLELDVNVVDPEYVKQLEARVLELEKENKKLQQERVGLEPIRPSDGSLLDLEPFKPSGGSLFDKSTGRWMSVVKDYFAEMVVAKDIFGIGDEDTMARVQKNLVRQLANEIAEEAVKKDAVLYQRYPDYFSDSVNVRAKLTASFYNTLS